MPAEADVSGLINHQKVPNSIFQAKLFKFGMKSPCASACRWTTEHDPSGVINHQKVPNSIFQAKLFNLA
jgi:hypothetical protein